MSGSVALSGSDGLTLADVDLDGHSDIVSVHEWDTQSGDLAEGQIRIAFGSTNPDKWELATLAAGTEAAAAEDAAIGDINGDGYPDIVAACELAHLIYLQNPGKSARTARWARIIPPVVSGRGSFIRVFLADFNKDGRLEIVTANKGAQNQPRPFSVFEITGDPLKASSWKEHELGRVDIPINAQPIDLDGDGDLDVLAGSRGERRIVWFENKSAGTLAFTEHRIEIAATPPAVVTGFNLDFADLSGDGRLDVVLQEGSTNVVWLEQPAGASMPWKLHRIGTIGPDEVVGFALADIDRDGDRDVMVGSSAVGPETRTARSLSPIGSAVLPGSSNVAGPIRGFDTTSHVANAACSTSSFHSTSTATAMSTSLRHAGTACPTTAFSGSNRSARETPFQLSKQHARKTVRKSVFQTEQRAQNEADDWMRIGLIGDYNPAVKAHQAIPRALTLASESAEWEWLQRAVELDGHPFFVATLFQPAARSDQ